MLLEQVQHTTPTYTISQQKRKELSTSESFGYKQKARTSAEKQRDQTQGRIGEYITAKFFADTYKHNWYWLDDSTTAEENWYHDFIINTSHGRATVDVKTRRVSDVQGNTIQNSYGDFVEHNPDFWTRFYATSDTQKTHIQNHIYILVLIYDTVENLTRNYSLGTIIGAVNGSTLLECNEYERNPDTTKAPVKFSIPASQACKPTSQAIENEAIEAITAYKEYGGYPSISNRLVNSQESNGVVLEETIQDNYYWNPTTSPLMTDDLIVTSPTEQQQNNIEPTIFTGEPLDYPIQKDQQIDPKVKEKYFEYNLQVTMRSLKLLTKYPMLQSRVLQEYKNTTQSTITVNHVLYVYYNLVQDSQPKHTTHQ
jgi:hypothetical protein